MQAATWVCLLPIHDCLELQSIEARAVCIDRAAKRLNLHNALVLWHANVRLKVAVGGHRVVQDLHCCHARVHVKLSAWRMVEAETVCTGIDSEAYSAGCMTLTPLPDEFSSTLAVKKPPCTRSVAPTWWFSSTIWLAPKGINSATICDKGVSQPSSDG